MSEYLNEAFKKFTLLEDSEDFAITPEGIENLGSFMGDAMNDDDLDIDVIDLEADTEEDLKQSYIGKVICDCNVCHSHIFYNKEDIVVDEDGVANIDDECPYCMSSGGYTIIGEIKPWVDATEEIIEEPSEEEEVDEVSEEELADEPIEIEDEEETEVVEESLQQESLNEDIQDVQVTTEDETMTMTTKEDGGVVIETAPIEEEIVPEEIDSEVESEFEPEEIEGFSDEMVAPISDETEQEILSNESEELPEEEVESEMIDEIPSDEEIEEEIPEEDVDVDEFEEENFDELGEAYLRKNYNNVKSFNTTQVRVNENMLMIEGVITFKNGHQKKTDFVFEAVSSKNNKFLFEGYNTQITGENKAFKLNCFIEGKKIIPESLKYDYSATNALNESVAVKGSVKTLKRK